MKGYTAQQVRDAEAPHLEAGEPLMERASAALARECRRMLEDEGISPAHARVVVLVGGGNNGGDALFAAAALAERGARVELIRTSSRAHEQGLTAAVAAGALEIAGDRRRAAARAASADLIVDGILGTGTSADPRLRGGARDLVAALVPMVEGRRSRDSEASEWPKVIAVDIPSGVHPDTGEVPDLEAVLRADVTVTFGGAKAGLLIPPASGFAGQIRLYDIGLAPDLEKLTPLIPAEGRTG